MIKTSAYSRVLVEGACILFTPIGDFLLLTALKVVFMFCLYVFCLLFLHLGENQQILNESC